MNNQTGRKLTPFETETGMRLLDSLQIGETIPRHLVAGGDGGHFPCGTPDWMITPENEVSFKRVGHPTICPSGYWVQRFSSVTELEAEIRWGSPWQCFNVRRTGERSYEMLQWESCAPAARSPLERLQANDWFGH